MRSLALIINWFFFLEFLICFYVMQIWNCFVKIYKAFLSQFKKKKKKKIYKAFPANLRGAPGWGTFEIFTIGICTLEFLPNIPHPGVLGCLTKHAQAWAAQE